MEPEVFNDISAELLQLSKKSDTLIPYMFWTLIDDLNKRNLLLEAQVYSLENTIKELKS